MNKLHIKWVLTNSSDSLKEILAVLRTKSFFGALYSDFTLRKTNSKSKSLWTVLGCVYVCVTIGAAFSNLVPKLAKHATHFSEHWFFCGESYHAMRKEHPPKKKHRNKTAPRVLNNDRAELAWCQVAMASITYVSISWKMRDFMVEHIVSGKTAMCGRMVEFFMGRIGHVWGKSHHRDNPILYLKI